MKFHAITDVGRMRSQNQDNVYGTTEPIGKLPNLFLVADGMGGHNAGDYASRRAIELVLESVASSKEEEPVGIMREAITRANQILYRESCETRERAGMGTTLVAAVVTETGLLAANVGDSRLYVLHEGELRQITLDHSLVEEMVRTGSMSQEAADHHPKKHLITRAVGAETDVDIDFFDVPLTGDEMIFMCSDGLSNMVKDDKIQNLLLAGESIEQRAESLVSEANQKGGSDNITVIVVEPFSSEVKTC